MGESDGFIFQGKNDPYSPGTFKLLLKFKFEKLNSVDVLLIVNPKLHINYKIFVMSHRGNLEPIGNDVFFPDHHDPLAFNHCIIECTYDKYFRKLLFIKKRPDKIIPNGIDVFKRVIKSIYN